MKLVLTTAILALFGRGCNADGISDSSSTAGSGLRGGPRRYGTHMWMFGENGVQIYTPSGEEVRSIPPEQVCKTTINDDGSERVRCDFNDVISDGNKYVWATVARGVAMVDVFRIDTGDLVGSFETCGGPRDLDFHPGREEVWVHCEGMTNATESHMDVFSSITPTAKIPTRVVLHDGTALRSRGKLQIHRAMGDVGYSTVYGQPYLYKIDLAGRRVMDQFSMDNGESNRFYGVYDMAYSPVNRHIYVRSEVCCTCGFEGADEFECGRYGSRNITLTEDGAEVETEGQCGGHCRGGPADTIGVVEFDTESQAVVGTHKFVGTAPVVAPFASPDGKMIVLFGMDGGKTVEILRAGESGKKSEIGWTLKLDFNTSNVEDSDVYDDFAYIKTGDKNCFVVSSASDYKVAIVDMDSPSLDVAYVTLKDKAYEGRARDRQIEWAEGTDYVWVGGRQDKEAYVIDLKTKSLVKTFAEVDSRKLLSVKHHRFAEMAADYGAEWMKNQPEPSQPVYDQPVYSQPSQPAQSGQSSQAASTVSAKAASDSAAAEGSNGNALAVAALIMSCVAIAAVVANFVAGSNKGPGAAGPSAVPLKRDDPSVQAPPSVN